MGFDTFKSISRAVADRTRPYQTVEDEVQSVVGRGNLDGQNAEANSSSITCK